MVLKGPIENPLLSPAGAEAGTEDALAEGDEVGGEDNAAADTTVVVLEDDVDVDGDDELLLVVVLLAWTFGTGAAFDLVARRWCCRSA